MENMFDLFLSREGRLNKHERVLMNDIMVKLLKNVEKKIYKDLSERLAESEDISIELVTMLANDHIEVAQPILEKNSLLKDEDLIKTIRDRTDAHRLAIAIRVHVSTEVSSELIEHGSEDVIEALVRTEEGSGPGLHISKHLAKQIGGDIILKSKVSEGSEFTVLLPLAK